jgi:hypothetical protein
VSLTSPNSRVCTHWLICCALFGLHFLRLLHAGYRALWSSNSQPSNPCLHCWPHIHFSIKYSATVPQLIQKSSPVSPIDNHRFGFEALFIAIHLLIMWAAVVKFGLRSSFSPTGYHQCCLSDIQQAPQSNSLPSIGSYHQPHSLETRHTLRAAIYSCPFCVWAGKPFALKLVSL